MGKYTTQASSYKHGMGMLKAGLAKAVSELEKVKALTSSGDSRDALNYYVSNFNNEITVSLNEVIGKSVLLPASVMNKAIEIDRRIELEEMEAKRRQEELEKAENNNGNTSDVSITKQSDTIIKMI